MAVGFFLEKQLASLRHLFPAKNPTATPRRRALAGFRLIRAAVRFALRAGSDQFDATFNSASGYSRCLLPFAFCFLLFTFSTPVLPVGRGVWGIFLTGKKMSERSELFFPEEKYPTPRVPARITRKLGAQTRPYGQIRTPTRFC
ncbi:MAG: hypothetical protein FHK81_08880 [Marinobacter vinifirmus]|uniref:Uncharacterized protein n=1 Tax=Marinobacter vinifirmus TaxID=355591 RepID=A0A558BAN2_9GAMM|nr:MAG: hypothetical protein FHK81_08880 [Marinobacter vinifirmus]